MYNFSFGWSNGKAVHFIYLSYLLLFQFVVNGGLGCLSYKHPKKITVSILYHKQSKFSGSAALKNQNLKKIFVLLFKILKKYFSNSHKFFNSIDYQLCSVMNCMCHNLSKELCICDAFYQESQLILFC